MPKKTHPPRVGIATAVRLLTERNLLTNVIHVDIKVRRAAAAGELPAEKRGTSHSSRWVFNTDDLIDWAEQQPA